MGKAAHEAAAAEKGDSFISSFLLFPLYSPALRPRLPDDERK